MANVTHTSWPVCLVCEGRGEENELGRIVRVEREVTYTDDAYPPGFSAGTYRITIEEWQTFDPPPVDAYRGRCRACKGKGRVPPEGWRDPVWDLDGRLISAGTHPDLLARLSEIERARMETRT